MMHTEIGYTVDKWEGWTYTDDPHDKGGATKYGISKRYHPDVDIKNLTRDAAIALYEFEYYRPMQCYVITSARVRWKLFDTGVMFGVQTAAKMFQRVLGVEVDGIIGSVTVKACNRMLLSSIGEMKILSGLAEEQMLYRAERVRSDPTQTRFLVGWTKRAFDRGNGVVV